MTACISVPHLDHRAGERGGDQDQYTCSKGESEADVSVKGTWELASHHNLHLPELAWWYGRISVTRVAQGQNKQTSHSPLVSGNLYGK